ncbi:DUF6252 family protein [Rasiella sp. SM2506]|uniref:DUF6252 family protein n=1 Tax=Rasiella sp. SM2506 TaxID=3423914 RepID=UPI003D79E089
MKKFQHLSLILLAFIITVFTSCDNEPLEGEFQQEDPSGAAAEGQFIATVAGESFVAENTQVVFFSERNILSITGTKSSTGEVITMAIENPSVSSFDLTQPVGFQVGAAYLDNDVVPNPYVSSGAFGGAGTLDLTVYDTDALTVSGTFAFTAARIQIDDMGMPVLDDSGAPVIETININGGAFNTIPYTIDNSMGGEDPAPNNDTIFAKADAVDFIPTNVVVSQYTVGMTPMIQIMATDSIGASLRLDIPETLAMGTFDLFNGISDGSNLIGYYNPNNGTETLSSNPGTITITEFSSFSGKLVASFEFTARDPLGQDPTVIPITEGNLDVTFVPTPGNITAAFEADVDGTNFIAETVTVEATTFNGVSMLTITASMAGETIQLDFPVAATTEGMYGMSPALVTGNEIVGTYLPTSGSEISFTSDPGTFTVTTFDEVANVLQGTFSFTAKDASLTDSTVYEITIGTFLVQL